VAAAFGMREGKSIPQQGKEQGMSTATFDLDVETIPVSNASLDHSQVRAEDAHRAEEALTPGTVNTQPVGLAKCHICCL
jgi:hypothetical protein